MYKKYVAVTIYDRRRSDLIDPIICFVAIYSDTYFSDDTAIVTAEDSMFLFNGSKTRHKKLRDGQLEHLSNTILKWEIDSVTSDSSKSLLDICCVVVDSINRGIRRRNFNKNPVSYDILNKKLCDAKNCDDVWKIVHSL